MITQHNLASIQNKNLVTLEQLKKLGFHIGEIAYLIETGRLIDFQDGYYSSPNKLQNLKIIESKQEKSSNFETKVLLSLLQDETKRFEINTQDSDWILLDEKSRVLEHKKGVIILKAMSEERRHKIYRFVKGIPCLNAFPIDKESEKKRVVLKSYKDDLIDINGAIKKANRAYQEKNFRQSIQYYLEALVHLRKPSSYLYGKLGLSYMQIGQKKKAIDYLTIADSLHRVEGKGKSFSGLIEELKQKKGKKADRKYLVLFEESDFKRDINENYGLDAIEEMAAFVSSGKTIEEVATMFSLNEEQVTLLILLFARNCYACGNFKLGDKYLKQAEKRKNKTEQAKKLLDEIRKKKRFYQNQVSEEVKPFVLTR